MEVIVLVLKYVVALGGLAGVVALLHFLFIEYPNNKAKLRSDEYPTGKKNVRS